MNNLKRITKFNNKALKSAYQIAKENKATPIYNNYFLNGIFLISFDHKLRIYAASPYLGVRIQTDFKVNTQEFFFLSCIPINTVKDLINSKNHSFSLFANIKEKTLMVFDGINYYDLPDLTDYLSPSLIVDKLLDENLDLDNTSDKNSEGEILEYSFDFDRLNTLYQSQKIIHKGYRLATMNLYTHSESPLIISSTDITEVTPEDTPNYESIAKWEGLIMPVLKK